MNRVKNAALIYDGGTHTVFCSLSLFYFSISNMLCRLAHSLVKPLRGYTAEFVYICE